jgi:mRNA-degrading endonuclease RelE of RelBE toxin-antitoxin system
LAYKLIFAKEVSSHLDVLTARQEATVMGAIKEQLLHEPTTRTKNRKPMDPDKRFYVAPWELRVGNLRVYYSVIEAPKRIVVITAVGVKVRDRVRIAGKEVE